LVCSALDDFLKPLRYFVGDQRQNAVVRTESEYALLAEKSSDAVRSIADSGKKIEAIKQHMKETGESLRESKRIVEAYLSQFGRRQ
jgi:ribosomal protein L7/L12